MDISNFLTCNESHALFETTSHSAPVASAAVEALDDDQNELLAECAEDNLDRVITLGDVKDCLRALMTQLDNALSEPVVMLHMDTALPCTEGHQDGAAEARCGMSLDASQAQSPEPSAFVASTAF